MPASRHRPAGAAPRRRFAPDSVAGPVRVLAIPPPCRAWLTVSNDPDNTLLRDWQELHECLWQELALPFGDALFVRSFNNNLPGQVNLHDHPHIAAAHAHDTLHAWGDYVHARTRGFDRADALEAIALLKAHGLRPRVWVDHSTHPQNMLHNATGGSTPRTVDGSGYVYESFAYTLDLAAELGIRYVWDGALTKVLGQDAPVSAREWYRHRASSPAGAAFLLAWHGLSRLRIARWGRSLVTHDDRSNRQYFAHRFGDGRTLYCFRRYGTWDDADIDGLGTLIAPARIDALVERQGTCIVYTHLGKRQAARRDDRAHIPPATRAALGNLRRQADAGVLKLSSVSGLLDYLVVRDAIAVSAGGDWLDFRPDGIRFPDLTAADLAGREFGLRIADPALAGRLEVRIAGRKAAAELREHGDQYYTVTFPAENADA